jgi:hypothetical protein
MVYNTNKCMVKHLSLKREIQGRDIGNRTEKMNMDIPIKNNLEEFQSKAIITTLIGFLKFCQDPK